jgi:ribosomal protein L22
MPSKPGNPSEGKANEPEQLEAEAAEAKAAASQEAAEETAEATEEAPQQVKKTRAKKAAPKADEDKPKPARKPRAKKAEEPKAEEPKAEEAKAEEAKAEKPKAEKPKAEEKPAGKPGRRRQAPERVVVRAHAKYVRTSARKARLVCDHIRGKDVAEARAILLHTNRQVAEAWSKLLESAIANAAENHSLDGEDLRVAFVVADEGPTLKRFRPRAMGRATKIRKRTSHLSIGLEPKE